MGEKSSVAIAPSETFTPIPATDIIEELVVDTPVVQSPSTVVDDSDTLTTDDGPAEPEVLLTDSDELVREAIGRLGGGIVATQFSRASNLLERAVSLTDNLAAGNVPYRLVPIAPPKKPFPIQDDGLRVTVDPEGYRRFDGFADWVHGLDAIAIVSAYQRFSAFADEAFALLGYAESDQFRDRINQALRLILTTPPIPADAELKKQEAVWVYVDDAIENLPELHKQLLRLGPRNLSLVQDKAREINYALQDMSQ